MESTDLRYRARNAIQHVARDHGLPTDLTVLSERWNTVVSLGETGVIARAATLAHLAGHNPADAFEQEVAVCRTLADRGAPVQEPIGNVVLEDGLPVSLWKMVQGAPGEASERAMVKSLARIHKLGAHISLDQPWFATVADAIPQSLAQLGERNRLSPNEVLVLHEYFNRSLTSLVPFNLQEGLIHGDAQRKNAIATRDGAIWIDFEDCCAGPYAWDLACLTMNPNYPTERVLDTYSEVSGSNRIPTDAMPHLWALRNLEALTWMLLIQEEREEAFKVSAQELLSHVLSEATDD